MADFYALLTVSAKASSVDIKTKYRQLSLKYHPDYGGSTEKMMELNEAYRVLSNPLLRREYDQKTASTSHHTTASHSGGSTAYRQQSYSRPVYRPNHTTQPTYRQARRYTQPTNTQDTKDTGIFWSWFGVIAVVAVAFLSYQIFTTLQPSTSAASTTTATAASPATSTVTTPTTSSTEDPSTTDDTNDTGTDTATPTYTSSTQEFRRRVYDNGTSSTTSTDNSTPTTGDTTDTSTPATSTDSTSTNQ